MQHQSPTPPMAKYALYASLGSTIPFNLKLRMFFIILNIGILNSGKDIIPCKTVNPGKISKAAKIRGIAVGLPASRPVFNAQNRNFTKSVQKLYKQLHKSSV